MSFICHIHNYTEYNEEWNVFSAFNPSKCTHLEQWAADCAAPGEQSWTSCQSRDPGTEVLLSTDYNLLAYIGKFIGQSWYDHKYILHAHKQSLYFRFRFTCCGGVQKTNVATHVNDNLRPSRMNPKGTFAWYVMANTNINLLAFAFH